VLGTCEWNGSRVRLNYEITGDQEAIENVFVLGIQLFYFGDFTPHIPLAFGIAITGLVGLKLGHKWPNIEEGVFHVINISLPSVSILITVGMIIGVWIASGTVPTLIYYGLKILDPSWFYLASCLICALVALSTFADRRLWQLGHRPSPISKYGTGLATLHRELPSNRWHRTLGRLAS